MRVLFLALSVAFTLADLAAGAAANEDRPNIVFILADDYGINGVGCYGSDRFQGKTPNIDALAAEGMRFEQCYSMPTCNPSRCALMTGRYGFRTGNKPSYQTEPSVAKSLKDAGYATGMAGKWRQMADTPRDWGFDEYLTDPEASGYYWERTYTKNDAAIERDQPIYYPDVCRDFAIDFFRRHRDRPFFFYYPTHLIHNPIVRTPASEAETQDADALYEDNVAYLDREVGALVAALEQLGMRERTVIVFAGDNGTAKYGYEQGTIGGRQISGMKGDLLEGGSRVPLVATWKGTIRPGQVRPDLVDFTDIFPTFCELAGTKLHSDVTIDGRSFAPQLRSKPGELREWVYVEQNTAPEWYVRNQGWKLTHRGELFDMSDAPFVEKLVPAGDASEAAVSARRELQAVLDRLDPASGKHVTPADRPPKKKAKKKKPKPAVTSKAPAADAK